MWKCLHAILGWVLAVGMAAGLAGCATGGPSRPPVVSDKLQVGDFVSVVFSGITPPPSQHDENIKDDGTISLPYIGAVKAAGTTPKELEREIYDKYVPNFYQPVLTVTVLSNARSFYVLNEVKSPGRYQWTGETTVVQAIAVAGSFTDFAKRKKIYLTRSNGERLKLDFNYLLEHPEKDPHVYPGDTIFVPRRYF